MKRKREAEQPADAHVEREYNQKQTKIAGDNTIDDCIGWLLEQVETVQPDSQTAKKSENDRTLPANTATAERSTADMDERIERT